MRTSIAAGLALLAVACTGQQEAPPARSVARPVPAPAPYRPMAAAPTPAPRPAPAPMAMAPMPGGPIHWHSRIAEAQAEARASGKLILVGSTKPGCGLCDKFAHETAPQCSGRLTQMAVCYMYDITRPEDGRVDRTLRANLPGAVVMPLVGFLTPDLQWVNGFSGPRSVSEFMGDIEVARRTYPVGVSALPVETRVSGPATAYVNEYGETEWSAPAGGWPAPEDALKGTSAVAAAPVAPALEPLAATPAPAAVEPAPVPAALPAAEPVAFVTAPSPSPEPAPAPEPAALPAWSAPLAPLPAGVAASSGPVVSLPVAAEPAPQAPVVEPAPVVALAPRGPMSLSEEEARESLARALRLIRESRFDEARDTLRLVSRALPNTALAREADKGGVAVYNARRIAEADADRRAELTERARRDLGATMWAPLF